jgi:hypothetical protein
MHSFCLAPYECHLLSCLVLLMNVCSSDLLLIFWQIITEYLLFNKLIYKLLILLRSSMDITV